MLDLKRVRSEPAEVLAALERRGAGSADGLAEILRLDQRRRELLTETERLKAERNRASDEVARRRKEGGGEPADELLAALKASGERVKALDQEVREVDAALEAQLLAVPNLPHPDVPEGDASANRIARAWGEPPVWSFVPRPHWELGGSLQLFDLARGAALSGSGFPVFTGQGARLVRALIQYMLDLHTERHGYTEIAPPLLVHRRALLGTGQLPKFEEDLYRTAPDDLFLIPTAEVPVTNLHREEILDAADLPVTYVAATPCFRREAGAHGKDTRGLIRVHQFDKVELVRLVHPEREAEEHALITAHAEAVLQGLEIPYRVVELAAGDTGFSARRTYDLEVWAPGADAWLEASSASTFGDFQARRAGIRFRPGPGQRPEFVCTLNASGVALPRTIAALLENHQQADGSVRVPAVLVPYLGRDRIAPPARLGEDGRSAG